MNLDKYRVKEPTSFDRYYSIFLQNIVRQKNYKITLNDDTSYTGIPTCGLFLTFANNSNVERSFYFKIDCSLYNIPFSELKEATLVNVLRENKPVYVTDDYLWH